MLNTDAAVQAIMLGCSVSQQTAASMLTAGCELRSRRDLHSFRWCRLPNGILRTALLAQL